MDGKPGYILKKNSWTLESISICVKVYPSTASAEFKILANRLTTVFLRLQMKTIRRLGNMQLSNLYGLHTAPCNVCLTGLTFCTAVRWENV